MENIIFGIITISVCVFGYFIAYRQFGKRKIVISLLLIMTCGLLLRLFTAADLYLHTWDERYHALVAKNLIEHPLQPTLYDNPILPYDYKSWTGNHIWIHKQPIPLWTMAISMSLLGINEIALRLPSIILTILGIWITFYIAKYLFNSRVGIIAAFLYSIHGLIIEITAGRVATDHIDVFFLFFIQLSVLFAINFVRRKKMIFNVLCGISIGLAILSKWLPALIVIPIWLLLVLDSKKFTFKEISINLFFLCFVIFIVSLPWQIYIFSAFPVEAQWESSFNLKHITEILDEQGGPFYYHFDKVRLLFGELIYIPLIWFIWKTSKNWKNYRRLIISFWFIIPFIFFSFVKTKMQGYTLFTAPAIFIITGLFWHYLYQYRNRFRFKWMIFIILFLLLALPVRYSIERIKPFINRDRNPQWVKELRKLNENLDINKQIVIFNVGRPIETMFYVNCIAYSNIPDIETIKRISDSGYTILINDDESINYEINQVRNVEIIQLTGCNRVDRQ
ncbi:MAG: glycosyltransferase family 39 protein [Bacteroidales bacterium]|nr:glycosyltransferase family 39 protein [Bacteroidales bacterium]